MIESKNFLPEALRDEGKFPLFAAVTTLIDGTIAISYHEVVESIKRMYDFDGAYYVDNVSGKPDLSDVKQVFYNLDGTTEMIVPIRTALVNDNVDKLAEEFLSVYKSMKDEMTYNQKRFFTVIVDTLLSQKGTLIGLTNMLESLGLSLKIYNSDGEIDPAGFEQKGFNFSVVIPMNTEENREAFYKENNRSLEVYHKTLIERVNEVVGAFAHMCLKYAVYLSYTVEERAKVYDSVTAVKKYMFNEGNPVGINRSRFATVVGNILNNTGPIIKSSTRRLGEFLTRAATSTLKIDKPVVASNPGMTRIYYEDLVQEERLKSYTRDGAFVYTDKVLNNALVSFQGVTRFTRCGATVKNREPITEIVYSSTFKYLTDGNQKTEIFWKDYAGEVESIIVFRAQTEFVNDIYELKTETLKIKTIKQVCDTPVMNAGTLYNYPLYYDTETFIPWGDVADQDEPDQAYVTLPYLLQVVANSKRENPEEGVYYDDEADTEHYTELVNFRFYKYDKYGNFLLTEKNEAGDAGTKNIYITEIDKSNDYILWFEMQKGGKDVPAGEGCVITVGRKGDSGQSELVEISGLTPLDGKRVGFVVDAKPKSGYAFKTETEIRVQDDGSKKSFVTADRICHIHSAYYKDHLTKEISQGLVNVKSTRYDYLDKAIRTVTEYQGQSYDYRMFTETEVNDTYESQCIYRVFDDFGLNLLTETAKDGTFTYVTELYQSHDYATPVGKRVYPDISKEEPARTIGVKNNLLTYYDSVKSEQLAYEEFEDFDNDTAFGETENADGIIRKWLTLEGLDFHDILDITRYPQYEEYATGDWDPEYGSIITGQRRVVKYVSSMGDIPTEMRTIVFENKGDYTTELLPVVRDTELYRDAEFSTITEFIVDLRWDNVKMFEEDREQHGYHTQDSPVTATDSGFTILKTEVVFVPDKGNIESVVSYTREGSTGDVSMKLQVRDELKVTLT